MKNSNIRLQDSDFFGKFMILGEKILVRLCIMPTYARNRAI